MEWIVICIFSNVAKSWQWFCYGNDKFEFSKFFNKFLEKLGEFHFFQPFIGGHQHFEKACGNHFLRNDHHDMGCS